MSYDTHICQHGWIDSLHLSSIRTRCRDKFCCTRTILGLGWRKNTRQAVYFIFLFRIDKKFVRMESFRIPIMVHFPIWSTLVSIFSYWKFKSVPGFTIFNKALCLFITNVFNLSLATLLMSLCQSSVRFQLDSKINHSNSIYIKIDMSS